MGFLKFNGKKGRQDEDMAEAVDAGGEGTQEGSQEAPVKGKKGSRKRKKGMMSKCFQESVWSQARESFEANPAFIGSKDGEKCYYGLAVTEEVLRDVDKQDRETKGSFINYVENGNIFAYASESTLDEGFVVVIPTKDTMENFSEFSALFERSLDIARVFPDGRAELNGYEIECNDVYNLAMGKIDAVDLGDDVLMRGQAAAGAAPGSAPKQQAPLMPAEPDNLEPVDDEVFAEPVKESAPVQQEPAYSMPAGAEEDVSFEAYQSVPDQFEDTFGFDSPGAQDADEAPSLFGVGADTAGSEPAGVDMGAGFEPDNGMDSEPASFGDAEFDNSYISPDGGLFGEGDDTYAGEPEGEPAADGYVARQLEVITQTFCPEDLNLEVSTAPFDAQFGNMDMVLFTETRPDGFFSEWLNSYCSVANVSLLQQRERNVAKLREMYMSLMGRVCEQISQDLNVDDPTKDTKFVRMKNDILDRREQSEAQMPERVAEKVAAIDRDWEESIQHSMQVAADRAKLNFQQNFGRQHAQRKIDVENEVKTEIEVAYNSEMNELQELRRKTAGMMLDLGVNAVLSQISARYQEMQDREQELYNRYASDIDQYIKDSRADEMARMNILANEQRQKAEAVRVREEMESRMASDAEQFKRRAQSYEDQIRKLEEEMGRRLKERDNTYREQLKSAQSVEKDLRNTIRQKDSAMGEAEARIKAEYEHQLAVKDDLLKSSEARFQSQVANMEEHNRYIRKMNIGAMIGVAIAALFFGMMAGAFLFRGSNGGNASQSRIEMEYGRAGDAALAEESLS